MKSYLIRIFQQLTRTRYFQSKPLLAPLLQTLWRYLRAGTPEAGEAAVRALAMSRFARYPILFRDRHDLEYLLYPDQNAEVYLANDGNYEVGETKFCLSQIQPGMIAFDVGANIGLYALLFAKCVGPAGRVHAFEPEPENFRRLTVNLAINRFENVTANPSAVFASSQAVTLNIYPDAFHSWHSLGRPALPDPERPGEIVRPETQLIVPAVSLDDYCAEHGVERIDFLKIDVEGAELDVLRGARGLLARGAVGAIQFEVSLPQITSLGRAPGEVFDFLRGLGFRCHPIAKTGELLPETGAAQAEYANYVALKAQHGEAVEEKPRRSRS